jgi:nucleotide-binding universal stress UspA family protein
MAAQPCRIVVGYDGSPAARCALDAVPDLAGYGSTLTIVAVTTEAGAGDTALAEAARAHLLQRHMPARYVQAVGDPADELVVAAREQEADLVVGRPIGGFDTAVLRRATCDVLVVSERA